MSCSMLWSARQTSPPAVPRAASYPMRQHQRQCLARTLASSLPVNRQQCLLYLVLRLLPVLLWARGLVLRGAGAGLAGARMGRGRMWLL